jgi:hypothetical protein
MQPRILIDQLTRTKTIMKFNHWKLGFAGLALLGLAYALDLFFGHAGLLGGALAASAAPVIVLPKDSKDLPGLKKFFEGVKQLCSASDTFDGPIRQMMEDLKTRVDAALTAMPQDESANWMVNEKVTDLLNLLGCANNLAAGLMLELNKMKTQMAGMVVLEDAVAQGIVVKKDAVPELIQTAIAERTGEAGDLTTKELAQQLCSAAEQKGIQQGIQQRNDQLAAEAAAATAAEERKTALTTAGLPLPEGGVEAILKAEKAAFEAARTTAQDRFKKLTEAGLDLEVLKPQLGKIWGAEAEYKTFESTVLNIPALKKPARVDEPLASPALGGAGVGKMIV